MTTTHRMAWNDGDPRHGTLNGYFNLRCRCEKCRTTNAGYQRRLRATRHLPPGDPRHGTNNGYVNYCCRCDRCRTANSATRRRWRTGVAS
jgi:hypothetical protein